MKNIKYTISAALGGMAIFASCAYAQGASNKEETGEKSAPAWTERESLFIASATEQMTEKTGFAPSLSWTGEAWGNVSNGNSISGIVDSLFTLGFEQDLSVLAGGEGWGRIGVSAYYYTQTNKGELSGFNSSQGCFSNIVAGDMARVFEIYYANEFETGIGSFGFRIGQLAADEDFMGMDYSDVFLNSSFGAMPNVAPGQLFSQYNVATLGVVAYYSYEAFDAAIGLYNGNIGQDISSNNGFDYANTFDTVALWYQFGYNYEIGGLSGRAMFGGNWYSDPRKANFDPIDTDSFYSFYFGLQQALVNDSEGNALFGVYARVGIVPESRASDQNFYADFGFNWFAPIPGRTDDVFAAGFSVVENERSARVDYAHYEGALEITYKCQLTPAISFQPDFQVFVNPGNRNESGATYVVGARVEVNF